MKKDLVIYQSKNGEIEFRGDLDKDTIWATQNQIMNLFGIDQSVVSRHIGKVFKDGEVDKKSNMHFMHIANSDKPVALYSLDVILAVGYRTNSSVAIQFRQWATKTLRQHITKGYTLNRKRIASNYEEFIKAVNSVKNLMPAGEKLKADDALELVKMFASTWFSLDAYDKSALPKKGSSKKQIEVTADELNGAIGELKAALIAKKEATELFAQEKNRDSIAGIVGNVYQTAFGRDVYTTLEEKAAHLLYFVVKNHPFTDGNKRSGAFAFVWFLNKTGLLVSNKISPEALTALTLLVAESNPKDKDKIIGLILQILNT